jgi:hypothetical protein
MVSPREALAALVAKLADWARYVGLIGGFISCLILVGNIPEDLR